MRNLFRRLAARHRVLIGACLALLAGFELLLCAIVATANVGDAIEQVFAIAPPIFRTMIEQTGLATGGEAGLLAFGWNHPIAHAVAAALAVTLATRAVAWEVESGAIELVLAQPISRMRFLAAQLVFAAGAFAVVTAGGVVATAVGQRVFALEPFGVGALGALFLNFVLLQAAIFAVTLMFSVAGREAGRVALAGFLIVVVSYLVQAVTALWSDAAFLERYSLHAYFDPRAIIEAGGLPDGGVAVLGAVTVCAVAFAAWRFQTRDFP